MPGNYGGFESLADNLVWFKEANRVPANLIVYCSSKRRESYPRRYHGAELRYIRVDANGLFSVLYDMASLISCVRSGVDIILLLGVSGAIALPLIRLISRMRIVTNIDGVEWKREKWRWPARYFLRLSEYLAVRCSHEVIADNEGIARHVWVQYRKKCRVIAYGGDHAVKVEPASDWIWQGAEEYALAICRIEPENNVELILEAFSSCTGLHLVFVGNWRSTPFGRRMLKRYLQSENISLLDPIYDLRKLRSLRERAKLYVHGHSAGGTNPSLVEMMHFRVPVLAFDCIFNRYTTEGKALFFSSVDGLLDILTNSSVERLKNVGMDMADIAQRRYKWDDIGDAYFKLLLNTPCSA